MAQQEQVQLEGQRRGLNERYCYDSRNEEAVLIGRCMLCTPSMVRT